MNVGCSTSERKNTCVTHRFEQNKHFLSKCINMHMCWQAQTSCSPLRPNKGLLKFLHTWQKTSGGSLPSTELMRKGFTIGLKSRQCKRESACHFVWRACTKSTQVSVTSLPPGVHHWAASISNHFVIPLPRFSVDGLTHCTQTRVISSNQ